MFVQDARSKVDPELILGPVLSRNRKGSALHLQISGSGKLDLDALCFINSLGANPRRTRHACAGYMPRSTGQALMKAAAGHVYALCMHFYGWSNITGWIQRDTHALNACIPFEKPNLLDHRKGRVCRGINRRRMKRGHSGRRVRRSRDSLLSGQSFRSFCRDVVACSVKE